MAKLKDIILLSVLSVLFMSSCSAAQGFPAQTDPDTGRFGNSNGSYEDDIRQEQDYSNINAVTDKEEYPSDFDKIKVTITNEEPGKGFYFFSIPVIEYNDNGEWTRLNYSPESYEIPEQWALCEIENAPEKQFSTVMTIFRDELVGEWKTGEYLAVVFAGSETVYAPFSIVDD